MNKLNQRIIIKIRNIAKSILILFLLIILSTVVYSEEKDYDSLVTSPIEISEGLADALLRIQSFLPNEPEKQELNEELKKDISTINSKKDDLDRYFNLKDYKNMNKTSSEIKELSYKVYSYDCVFKLRPLFKKTDIMVKNYQVRLKSDELKNVPELLKEKDKLVGDYFIKVGDSGYFSSYRKYFSNCSNKLKSISLEYQSLKSNYRPFDWGGFGWALFGLTFSFLAWIIMWVLFDKKFGKLTEKNLDKLGIIGTAVIGGVWGLWFISSENYFYRFLVAGFIGFALFFLIKKALLFLKHNIFKITPPKETTTPIKELKLEPDYIHLFEEEDIKTIEDLIESDIKNLAHNTGLQVETLIDLKKRGNVIIKNKSKRTRKK